MYGSMGPCKNRATGLNTPFGTNQALEAISLGFFAHPEASHQKMINACPCG
jgi:hypothetical protein